MSVVKFIKAIRTHWKKSACAAGIVAYAVSYSVEKYKITEVMRAYCEEASRYGDATIKAAVVPKRIIVVLNPAANKKSAEKTYEKYCEPILQLGGFLVDVVRTDSEGHATRYVEDLENLPDAILIAGGDGTASEAVTGLMRRKTKKQCPIGILPLGRTNSIAAKFYNFSSDANNLEEVRQYASAAIAVIRGKTKKKNIMQINPSERSEDESTAKPIFALGSLHWGAFRDAKTLRDKYWYVGPWREHASTLFHAFDNELTWKCKAKLLYTPPCTGCRNCFVKDDVNTLSSGRWWTRFIPRFKLGQQSQNVPDYSQIENDQCTKQNSMEISPTEVILSTGDENDVPRLTVEVEGPLGSSFDFIKEGWRRINTKTPQTKRTLEARTIELIPETASTEEKEIFYSIDSEAYEVRHIKITVLPKAIEVFTL